MVRSQNWPDLRSPKSKFRDINFVGTDALINSWKFHIDTSKTSTDTSNTSAELRAAVFPLFAKNLIGVVKMTPSFTRAKVNASWRDAPQRTTNELLWGRVYFRKCSSINVAGMDKLYINIDCGLRRTPLTEGGGRFSPPPTPPHYLWN